MGKAYLQFGPLDWVIFACVPLFVVGGLRLLRLWPLPVATIFLVLVAHLVIFPEWASTMRQPPLWKRVTWKRAVASLFVVAVLIAIKYWGTILSAFLSWRAGYKIK